MLSELIEESRSRRGEEALMLECKQQIAALQIRSVLNELIIRVEFNALEEQHQAEPMEQTEKHGVELQRRADEVGMAPSLVGGSACIAQLNTRREKSDAQTQLQIERERLKEKARDVQVLRQELKEGTRPLGVDASSLLTRTWQSRAITLATHERVRLSLWAVFSCC